MVDPDVRHVDPFTVAGLDHRGAIESDEFGRLWEAFGERLEEFRELAAGDEAFGVSVDYDPDSGELEYVAGVRVEDAAAVPDDMRTVEVPGGTYAAVACRPDTVDETMAAFHREWFPASGYERAAGVEFERYGETFDPSDPSAEYELYVPVRDPGE